MNKLTRTMVMIGILAIGVGLVLTLITMPTTIALGYVETKTVPPAKIAVAIMHRLGIEVIGYNYTKGIMITYERPGTLVGNLTQAIFSKLTKFGTDAYNNGTITRERYDRGMYLLEEWKKNMYSPTYYNAEAEAALQGPNVTALAQAVTPSHGPHTYLP